MEQQRLSYYVHQQAQARANKTRITLPSAHTQSPRWYADKRDNTMATVVRRGKPTLFITFTFNPKWEEVTRELAEGEDCADQPFLVNSVFAVKLKLFVTMITNGEVFGVCADYVTYVIEFQKRGYPHAHILVRLSDAETSPHYIDRLVTVAKPAAGTDDCKLVEELMEHHCDARSVCRDAAGQCKRGFPKPPHAMTTIDAHGYPHYKRDERGARVVAYNMKLLRYFGSHINVEFCGSNAVVGYVLQYSYKGVDRLLVRQTQQQLREQRGAVDEIAEFQSLRCVGSLEAAWRVALHDIVSSSVAVTSFSAHLPGQAPQFGDRRDDDAPRNTLSHVERYFVRPTDDRFDNLLILDFTEQWAHIPAPRTTDVRGLTAFEDAAAAPAKCWWWGQRHRPHAARMYSLLHTAGEQYYVRLLLLNVAARSFEQLRTVNGTVLATFAEAARMRGLIDDVGGEYSRVMRDAVAAFATPARLRQLFVSLVCNGAFAVGGTGASVLLQTPVGGTDVDTARVAMQYDYYCRHLQTATGADASLATVAVKQAAHDAADLELLRELHRLFEARGFVDAVARYGLPPLPGAGAAAGADEQLVLEGERNRWRPARAAAAISADVATLTPEQKGVFDGVANLVGNRAQGLAAADVNVFVLCASAGCGKTFVARLLIEQLRAHDHVVVVVATTGIAATMLPGGTTVHRRFSLPIEDRALGRAGGNSTTDGIDATDARVVHSTLPASHPSRTLLKHASLLLWDEAFSASRSLFKSVDQFLRAARNDTRPFGGVPTLLIGDPRQIPPIIPGTLAEAAVRLESLQSWQHYTTARKFVLTRAMRQSADAAFAALLCDIGDGQAGVPVGQANDSSTHRRLLLRGVAHYRAREQFLQRVFPNLADPVHCASRAIICSRNDDVLAWNNRAIDLLPGIATRLTGVTQLADYTDPGEAGHGVPIQYSVFTDEYLATVQPSGVPPHTLTLKPGAVAVLISNLAPDDGLTNGTKIIVDQIVSPVLLRVRARSPSTGALSEHYIPRLRFKFNLHRTQTAVVRTQFPLLPAYAITCNRAQCQTLDFVGLDATVDVFAHGALFVSLSRVRRAADLCVFVGGKAAQQQQQQPPPPLQLINVVFRSLLRDVVAADETTLLMPPAPRPPTMRHQCKQI